MIVNWRQQGEALSEPSNATTSDLHQLYGRSVYFNEGDQHPGARTVGVNDYLLIPDRLRQVINASPRPAPIAEAG